MRPTGQHHLWYIYGNLESTLAIPVKQFQNLKFQLSTLYIVKYLMIMENDIRIPITTRYCVCPKFFHKEYLVGELRYGTYKENIMTKN